MHFLTKSCSLLIKQEVLELFEIVLQNFPPTMQQRVLFGAPGSVGWKPLSPAPLNMDKNDAGRAKRPWTFFLRCSERLLTGALSSTVGKDLSSLAAEQRWNPLEA